MLPKGLFAVIRRELDIMVSKPIYLVITIIIPLIVIVFFATFFNKGIPSNLPIAIVDKDNSATSRLIARTIDAGQICNVQYRLSSYSQCKDLMQKGKIYAFVIIPHNFENDIYNKLSPKVNFYTEYMHYLAGSLIMKEISVTLTTLSAGANLKVRLQKGESIYSTKGQIQPIATDQHIIGNPQLNYSFYLAPVMMPGIIFLMALICTIYVIGLEFKTSTSKRWLVVGKKNITISMLGKLLPYTLIYALMVVLSELVMEKLMGFPSKGNPILLYLGALLTVFAYQCVGVFLIGLVPSLRTALSVGALYGVIGFTLAGFTYPHFAMLSAVKPFTYLYPLRQYYMIYCNVQINGLDFKLTIMPFVYLIMFFIIPYLVLWNIKRTAIKLDYEKD